MTELLGAMLILYFVGAAVMFVVTARSDDEVIMSNAHYLAVLWPLVFAFKLARIGKD